jgi:hypothetical protein
VLRRRAAVALTAVVAAVVAAGLGRVASADVPPITIIPPGTTTTTPGPAPPTAPTPPPIPRPSPTTTAPPAPGSSAPPSPTSTTTVPPGAPPIADAESTGTGVVPPEYQPLIASVVRSAPNSTDELIEALAPLLDAGATFAEAAAVGFGHFPVAGPARFSDDWWMPRFTPAFHLHQGTDVFAAAGTPVRAPFAGTVRFATEAVGGLSAYVHLPDGTFLYSTHLSAFAPGLSSGTPVAQGDIIGFVGDTGNALGGTPHVHFEIHPQGGGAVNPKPFLDQWLADARAAAPALVARARARAGAGGALRFEVEAATFAAPAGRADGPLGWASALSPAGSAARVAQAHLGTNVTWRDAADAYQLQLAAREQADAAARAALARLTPTPLRGFF